MIGTSRKAVIDNLFNKPTFGLTCVDSHDLDEWIGTRPDSNVLSRTVMEVNISNLDRTTQWFERSIDTPVRCEPVHWGQNNAYASSALPMSISSWLESFARGQLEFVVTALSIHFACLGTAGQNSEKSHLLSCRCEWIAQVPRTASFSQAINLNIQPFKSLPLIHEVEFRSNFLFLALRVPVIYIEQAKERSCEERNPI